MASNNARLLASDANTRLYFQANANYFGTVASAVTFRAWDQTSGSNGTLVDTSTNGGTTAFSSATDTASLVVNPVADTPSVTNATTNEDTQTTSGLVISRNAADGAEVTHFKITGITNGTLYKNDGTTQITSGTFITFAEGNAGLKFTPTANFNGSGSFTIQASTSSGDAGLGEHGGRDDYGQYGQRRAGADALRTCLQHQRGSFIHSVTAAMVLQSSVSDVDAGAQQGIAVFAAAGSGGAIEYSIDGGANWSSIGTVSATNALVLRATDSIRFTPDANNGGTLTLDYRAWDQTFGTAGTKVDASSTGGTTAFSTGSDRVTINVASVNDAPVLDNTKSPTLTAQNEDSVRCPAPWAHWSRVWWTSRRLRARWITSRTWTAGRCWASQSQRPTRPTAPGTSPPTAGPTGTPLGR